MSYLLLNTAIEYNSICKNTCIHTECMNSISKVSVKIHVRYLWIEEDEL